MGGDHDIILPFAAVGLTVGGGHGTGSMTTTDGETYGGEWKDDIMIATHTPEVVQKP